MFPLPANRRLSRQGKRRVPDCGMENSPAPRSARRWLENMPPPGTPRGCVPPRDVRPNRTPGASSRFATSFAVPDAAQTHQLQNPKMWSASSMVNCAPLRIVRGFPRAKCRASPGRPDSAPPVPESVHQPPGGGWPVRGAGGPELPDAPGLVRLRARSRMSARSRPSRRWREHRERVAFSWSGFSGGRVGGDGLRKINGQAARA
jgi:hypothetical protein